MGVEAALSAGRSQLRSDAALQGNGFRGCVDEHSTAGVMIPFSACCKVSSAFIQRHGEMHKETWGLGYVPRRAAVLTSILRALFLTP